MADCMTQNLDEIVPLINISKFPISELEGDFGNHSSSGCEQRRSTEGEEREEEEEDDDFDDLEGEDLGEEEDEDEDDECDSDYSEDSAGQDQ